jgi:hypothetical protein
MFQSPGDVLSPLVGSVRSGGFLFDLSRIDNVLVYIYGYSLQFCTGRSTAPSTPELYPIAEAFKILEL